VPRRTQSSRLGSQLSSDLNSVGIIPWRNIVNHVIYFSLFLFSDINISQGSVAIARRLRYGGTFYNIIPRNLLKSAGERILKIGQHFEKLEAKIDWFHFTDTVYICFGCQEASLCKIWCTICTYALGYLWPPYVIGGPLYFCPVVSFLPSFLLLSSFFFLA